MGVQNTLRLSARGISKHYGAVQALTDATLELRPGEVMALLGENGAGKSTIVKVLSGLVVPDEGVIEIDGAPVKLESAAASQLAGVAVVQQEYSTVPTLSVAENLVLGQHHARAWWSRKYLKQNADSVLDRVGLGSLDPETPVGELSVAEMQLLEIARVLTRDARVLIFDEPTAALSDAEIQRVLGVIRGLAAEGRSIVYVSHRLKEIFEIADRMTIFRNGRSQPARDVAGLDVDDIVTAMLGRQLDEMYPPHAKVGDAAPAALEVDGLRGLGFGPVDLTVRNGEILGLTGQLGSGASTCLQALAGVSPVLGGTVELAGAALPLTSRRAGIASGVAYCSADRKKDGTFAGVSIARNMSAPWLPRVANLGVVSPRAERSAAMKSARDFAVDLNRLGSTVGTLSGGNQQKVAVGKWLGTDPRVLLVDEPTRGVDVGARAEIYQRLRDLASTGLVVVVCSSDTNEVFGLCDTIATFHRGRMTACRPHTEWSEVALVREVMHSEGGAA